MNKLKYFFHFVPTANGLFTAKRHMELPYPMHRNIQHLLGSSISCYPKPNKFSNGAPRFITLRSNTNRRISTVKLIENGDFIMGCAPLEDTSYVILVLYTEHCIHMFIGDKCELSTDIEEIIVDESIIDDINLLTAKHEITQRFLSDFAMLNPSYINHKQSTISG